MPPLLTSIGSFKQNLAGGAFASDPLAAASADSLSILNFVDGSRAFVEEVVASSKTNSFELAIFGNRFGDPILGVRVQSVFVPTLATTDKSVQWVLPKNVDIPVYRTDTLTQQVLGTAADNVDVVMQVYYENVDGTKQRLANWEGIVGNIERFLAVEVTVTPGATGNYGTAVALNANDDRLVADYDYALLGYTLNQPVTSIGIKGPDTGNFRIAMPGHWDARNTAGYFQDQDTSRPTPHIPIINALNKTTTFLDGLSAAGATATKVSLFFAQLRNRFLS